MTSSSGGSAVQAAPRRAGWTGAYRQLWHSPGMPPLLVGFVLARLPAGAVALTFTLATLQRTGSLALAGVVSAGYAVAMGVGVPLSGRLVDRRGPVRVLVVTGFGYATSLLVFAAVSMHLVPLPTWTLPAAALLAGGFLPPVAPVVRSLWGTLLDEPTRRASNAVESVLLQSFYIVGPAVVGLLTLVHRAPLALVVCAVLNAIGVFLVATSAAARSMRRRAGGTHRLAALRQPGMLVVLAIAFSFSVAYEGLDFAVFAWADDRAEPGLAGLVLAVASVAGLTAAAVHGGHPGLARVGLRGWCLVWGSTLVVLGVTTALHAGFVWVAAATLVSEAAAAPLLTLLIDLVNDVVTDGLQVESVGWRMSATMVGASVGAAVCGGAADLMGAGGPAVAGIVFALVTASLAVRHRGHQGHRSKWTPALR